MQLLAQDCFQVAVGQLELIGNVSEFTLWANLVSHSTSYVGPHISLLCTPLFASWANTSYLSEHYNI